MRSKPLVLASLVVAAFTINLDTTIVNVALPTLVRRLNATNSQLQWVVDAYNLVFAALLLTSGSLSDRLGRKGMLLGGLGLFSVASFIGGLTTTPVQLIGARVAMGLGAAMIFPATLSLIANVFTGRVERARAIGIWGASAGVAVAMGPIAGGWLLEHFGWASIFYAMAPVGLLAAVMVAASVPRSRDRTAGRIDPPGFGLSTLVMAILVFSLIEAPVHGWAAGRTVAGFLLAASTLAVFVVWERSTPHPMLDVSLFRVPRFTAASASVTVAFFALFGFIFLMTQYFQFIQGYGALSTGVHLLPVAVSVGAASVVGTKLAIRFGTKLIVTAGLLATTLFYGWVAAVIDSHTSYGVIAVQMVLYGIGMGFTSAPATESIMGAVSRQKAGVGSAVNDATRLLGGTLGVAVIGSVYASLYGFRLSQTLPARLPAYAAQAAHQSVGAALVVAQRVAALGHPQLAGAVHQAATNAFLHGISVGCLVAGAVAAGGALLAGALLPAQPPTESVVEPAEPDSALVPVPVLALDE
ncbi:MAG TPA: MFS transporter [Acidimicrobiales bacterium]|nr:MFS transporter [Acidimicrobiales bacterium]